MDFFSTLLLMGGSQLLSGLIQADAASEAAQIQAGASQESIAEQRRQFDRIQQLDNYAHGEVSREVMIAARNEAMQALNGDASEAAEACARVDAFDAAWSAVVLAAKHVPADVLTQEFERVFCND